MAVNIFPGTYSIGSAASPRGHKATLIVNSTNINDIGVLQYQYRYQRNGMLFFDLTALNKAVAVVGYPQGSLALQYVLGISPFDETTITNLADPCNVSGNIFKVDLQSLCGSSTVTLQMKGLLLLDISGSIATNHGYLAESMTFMYSQHEYTKGTGT